MPIINGTMLPEGRSMLHNFNELNILLLGEISADMQEFAIQISTLQAYLRDTVGSDIKIKLHCTSIVSDGIARSFYMTKHDINPHSQEELLSVLDNQDFDIVFDQNDEFSQQFFWKKFYEFEGVKSLDKLKESAENYLVGSGIFWVFSQPVWNMPLFMKYMSTPGIGMNYFSFMGACKSLKGYSDDQQEKVRYISNKIQQVQYGRDLLHYYVKRMRKARRSGMPDDDYNIQLNYHLSNYYFLIAGTLDSLARLINNVYKLELTRYSDLALEKENFIEKNRRKRTGFVRIFKNKSFVKWASFLKERRNFIAHDGDVRQTPLVEQKQVLLTDAEVEAIVDGQMNWNLLSNVLPSELVMAQRDQAAQLVRIQHDYKVIAEKIMMIPMNNGGHKLHSPLMDIDHDYEQFTEVMTKALAKLQH